MQYWKNKSGKAEVDFLFETEGEILPLEVKAGINLKSKSLQSFDTKFNPSLLYRTSLRNLRKDDKICNIPLYCYHRRETDPSCRLRRTHL